MFVDFISFSDDHVNSLVNLLFCLLELFCYCILPTFVDIGNDTFISFVNLTNFLDIVFSMTLSIDACCLRNSPISFRICSTISVSTEIWDLTVMVDGCAEELSAVFWTDVATMDNSLDHAFFGGDEYDSSDRSETSVISDWV